MKIIFLSLLLLCTTVYGKAQQSAVQIIVSTKNTSLIYKVGKDQRLYQSYLGTKLSNSTDLSSLSAPVHVSYATFGTDNLFEPAIRVTHNDGNPSLELQYVNNIIEKKDENVTITHIKLKDPQYAVEVTLNLKAYFNENIIE